MASCHYNRQPWYDLYGWLGIDWALTVNKINTPLLQQKNVTGQSFFNGGCTIIQSSMHTLSAHSCKALLQVLERATKTWHPKYQCARGKHSQQRLTVVSCARKFSTLEIKKRGGGVGVGVGVGERYHFSSIPGGAVLKKLNLFLYHISQSVHILKLHKQKKVCLFLNNRKTNYDTSSVLWKLNTNQNYDHGWESGMLLI